MAEEKYYPSISELFEKYPVRANEKGLRLFNCDYQMNVYNYAKNPRGGYDLSALEPTDYSSKLRLYIEVNFDPLGKIARKNLPKERNLILQLQRDGFSVANDYEAKERIIKKYVPYDLIFLFDSKNAEICLAHFIVTRCVFYQAVKVMFPEAL